MLGWEIIDQDMGPMGTDRVVRGGGHGGWAGMMTMPPDIPAGGTFSVMQPVAQD